MSGIVLPRSLKAKMGQMGVGDPSARLETRIWLGSYEAPEMAAAAYDVGASQFLVPSARLNFPEFLGALPRPTSSQAEDVGFAAQQAALMFRRPLRSSSPSAREVVQDYAATMPTSQIEPMNDSPLDSTKKWMQMAEAYMLGLDESEALYKEGDDGLELRRWEEILNNPTWDF